VQLDEPSLLAPTCCCTAASLDPPWNLVQHSRIAAISVDGTALRATDLGRGRATAPAQQPWAEDLVAGAAAV
jgi:hypothetical protein